MYLEEVVRQVGFSLRDYIEMRSQQNVKFGFVCVFVSNSGSVTGTAPIVSPFLVCDIHYKSICHLQCKNNSVT